MYSTEIDGKEHIIASRVTHKNTSAMIKAIGVQRTKEINQSAKAQHAAAMGVKLHGAAQSLLELAASKSKNKKPILKNDYQFNDEEIKIIKKF